MGERPRHPIGDALDRFFPSALALGMTAEGYWDGPAMDVCVYREADRIRADRENRVAWLHGLYAYRAVASLAPALNPLSRRRHADEYPRPLELDPERRARDGQRHGIEYMRAVMESRARRGSGDGREQR